ncbi:MAG: hypothetical protein LUE64_00195 [Candidatus Gastranaerophilales bacterium]|nr:hypothetical protein [Candidatus Gastranaerophilales bacterium]
MGHKVYKILICTFFAWFFSCGKIQAQNTEGTAQIETGKGQMIELLPENVNKSSIKLFKEENGNILPDNDKNSKVQYGNITKSSIPFVKTQEDFEITKEDIKNAIPTEADVILSKKDEHDIKVMETRHFEKINDYDSPKYRVAKLENYLLGRTWEFSPLPDRMRRLRLASQRKMLSGTSLPIGIRRYASPSRIANDSTPVYENEDNVGLIDGLMRLYAPEAYKNWSERKKRLRKRYNDG